MTVSHSPAPARSDVAAAANGTATPTRPYAVHGLVLTTGALAWAATMAVVGLDPQTRGAELAFSLSSGLFQVGLLFLLRTLWRTRALGVGRLARAVLRVEAAAVLLAICSTAGDGLGFTDMDQVGWLLLDAFWPLSMLGMFLIGIRIAIAGRWRGVTRFWPMVAESWAVVTIPALGIFGETVGHAVACLHLVVGYAVLGVLVARKTD
ncbi:hypothetical protein HN031_08665 [Nocardioides sp. zg-1308]|uniref:hypothetical protein n=1 Tax=Nocardioides sp. zg-1308 TaxID=2736253 RepID=UPI001553277F|nr:hypothetical protein [Nocardioides sp. zg-1308]NPD04751.1 hypothetical protein [Nocardioides sp. zg-1308]